MTGAGRIEKRGTLSASLLLLQFAFGGLVPFADARLEASAAFDGPHIESDSTSCPASHNHRECEFCRHLASNQLTPTALERPIDVPVVLVCSLPSAEARLVPTSIARTLSARAPPTA